MTHLKKTVESGIGWLVLSTRDILIKMKNILYLFLHKVECCPCHERSYQLVLQSVAIDSSGQANTSSGKATIMSSPLTKEGDYREYKADVITQDSRHCSRHGCIQDLGESRVIRCDLSIPRRSIQGF